MPWKNYFCAEYPPRHTSLPSAHLGKLLILGIREEGLKGEEDPATALDISKPDAFGGRGAKKGSEEEATKAWKGLGTPPRYAVLIQPARKIDEPPDFLSNHRCSDTCSQLHNFSPLFVRGHSGRSRSRSGSHASTFSAMIFLLNFQIFHDSFFLSSFFILDLGKQKFAEGKKIGFKRDRFIPVVRNFAGEFHFPESTSENRSIPENRDPDERQRVNENRSASIKGVSMEIRIVTRKEFPEF